MSKSHRMRLVIFLMGEAEEKEEDKEHDHP